MSLISIADLAADPAAFAIADVRWYLADPGRGRREYESGHIPGAVFVDLDADLSDSGGAGRHPLPTPKQFEETMAAIGFGSDDQIVAYDDGSGAIAARMWWMLDNLGHASAAVLDGGYAAWVKHGHDIETGWTTRNPATVEFGDSWSRVVDRDQLNGQLGSVTLLDARPPDRYRGEVETIDAEAGHIPTALSAPTKGNVDPDGLFLKPADLKKRFELIGADAGDVVTSCGSGVTSCHNALAMRLAGLPDPILYTGSWSDWSRAGMPFVTGPDPGQPE